jgi:transcriptional regulator GlxA family with amidase domain
LEIAKWNYDKDSPRIRELRYLFRQLNEAIPEAIFNGNLMEGLYTVLSVSLPRMERSGELLFHLDIRGICVSGGSACTAGAGSHVMRALGREHLVTVRFSFSKWNTKEEVDWVVGILTEQVGKEPDKGEPAEASLKELVNYIRVNLDSVDGRLAVPALCRRFGYNKVKLARLLKRKYGLTPAGFVLEQPINLAKHFLVDSRLGIAEIAEKTGFGDGVAFNKSFKRQIGMPPSKFREKFSVL